MKQSVSSAKVNPRVASLLEKIAECPNIPRKRAKFEVSTSKDVTFVNDDLPTRSLCHVELCR